MTRINSAINVNYLTDEHLLAEHREIKRVPHYLSNAIASGSINKIPEKFCLGSGHILFFLNKLQFIYNRYVSIHKECISRGFHVQDYSCNFLGINRVYFNNYTPTNDEKELLISRISDRINNGNKQNYHYYSSIITKEKACELLYDS